MLRKYHDALHDFPKQDCANALSLPRDMSD
jgi:hypothetical protein